MIKRLKSPIIEQSAGSLKKFVAKDKLGQSFSKVRKLTQKIVAKELAENEKDKENERTS